MKSLTVLVGLFSVCMAANSVMTSPAVPDGELITEIISYPDTAVAGGDSAGAGFVVVKLTGLYRPVACPHGYYLNPAHVGYKSTYGLLVAAWLVGRKVKVWYDDADFMPGQTVRYCKISAVVTGQ
jgi:hypothetical protein